jgi:VWFA-related protein
MRVAPYLIVLSASVALFAQDQADRPFQTEVNYVRVDMYPTADGKPVTDLVQAEVEVLEDGAPQKVAQFEHVFISGPRPQTTRREPSTLDEMRRAAQDPRARVFVLFLDPRHVDVQGSMRVRRPLIEALNSLIGGDDLIAVMTPEMSARGLTFTRRIGSIEAMLTPHWGQEHWAGSKDPVEARYDACYGLPIIDGPAIAQEMIARRREVLVLDAVESLVEYLRGLREERKAVITISDGWPLYGQNRNLAKPLLTKTDNPNEFGHVNIPIPKVGADPRTGRPTVKDPSSVTISSDGVGTLDRASCEVDRFALSELNNEERFTRLMQGANRANVSFYPVGPGGFSESYSPLSARRRSLQMMADITDGRAVLEPVSMETGLRRMVDDLSSYYLVGYYSDAKPDGRFHRITVRVKRPGVQVRARSGYLAASRAEAAKIEAAKTDARVSSSMASPDAAEAQLVTRALNPLAALARERPVRVQAVVAWTPTGTAVVRAVTEVSRDTTRGDDWGKGAQLQAMLRDASGNAVANAEASIAPGTFITQLTMTPKKPLAAGDYELQIRAKGAQVVSLGIEELRITIPAAPAGGGVLFMRRGQSTGNREVPTADARFRRAERLILEAPAGSAPDVSARLLDRAGKALSVPVTAVIREDADGLRWRRVEVILAPLAQGDYIVELTAGSERSLTGFRVVP